MSGLLSTRDALARALNRPLAGLIPVEWSVVEGSEFLRRVADVVIASGAVVDVATLADDEALRFTDEDIENANAAMGEGEWQWFQWLLREKVRALAAALTERAS